MDIRVHNSSLHLEGKIQFYECCLVKILQPNEESGLPFGQIARIVETAANLPRKYVSSEEEIKHISSQIGHHHSYKASAPPTPVSSSSVERSLIPAKTFTDNDAQGVDAPKEDTIVSEAFSETDQLRGNALSVDSQTEIESVPDLQSSTNSIISDQSPPPSPLERILSFGSNVHSTRKGPFRMENPEFQAEARRPEQDSLFKSLCKLITILIILWALLVCGAFIGIKYGSCLTKPCGCLNKGIRYIPY